MSQLYVFALCGDRAEGFIQGSQRVDFVPVGGIFAAASVRDTRPDLNEAALREQHAIVAAIAERVDAVVPARFGSLVARAELERVVALRQDVIVTALELVRGRVQMTIRVYRVEPAVSEDKETVATSGTDYLERRRAAAQWTIPPQVAQLRQRVSDLVVAEHIVRGQRLVEATMYHLVARGSAAEYARCLDASLPELSNVPFVVSGPWPPFAFAPELWP